MQLDQEVMGKNTGSGSAGFKSRIIGRYAGAEGPLSPKWWAEQT